MILDLPIFSKSLAECQYHQYIILLYTTDGPRSMLFKMFTLVNEVNVFGLHDVRIMKALTYWPIISAEMFISRQCRYSILRPLSDDTGNKLILSHLRYLSRVGSTNSYKQMKLMCWVGRCRLDRLRPKKDRKLFLKSGFETKAKDDSGLYVRTTTAGISLHWMNDIFSGQTRRTKKTWCMLKKWYCLKWMVKHGKTMMVKLI